MSTKDSGRTINSIRNTAIGIVMQAILFGSSFCCRMVFVRCLESAYLGVSGLFGNILTMLSVAELGISGAMVFELYQAVAHADDDEIKSLMRVYGRAYITIGTVIFSVGLAVMPLIGKLVEKDEAIVENIYVLYLLYLISTAGSYFFSYKGSIIGAAQKNYYIYTIHAGVTVAQNVSQIVILLLTHNFLIYLIIQVAASLVENIIVSIRADKLFPILKEKDVKPLADEPKKRILRNVRYAFVSNITGKLMGSIDNIVITFFGGLAVTGLNSNYSLINLTLITFTEKIGGGLLGSLGNLNALESTEKQMKVYYELKLLLFWIHAFASISFIILVQDVIELFFGANYLMGFEIAVITGINFFTIQENTVNFMFRSTLGLFRYGRYNGIFSGLINTFASIYFCNKWGVFGVLLATFITEMFVTRWYDPYALFRYGFKQPVWPYFKKSARFWAEYFFTLGVTIALCELFEFSLILDLLIRGVICLVVPNVIIYFLHRKDKEFEIIINRANSVKTFVKTRIQGLIRN